MHNSNLDFSPHRLPPSAARRRRSTILTDTGPYPTAEQRRVSTFGVPAAQLSPIPTDDDVEHALRFSHAAHVNPPPCQPTQLRDATADLFSNELTQAIKLLSLERSPDTPSMSNSASSTSGYGYGPDPEEILKEVIRESLQALQAFRYARHLTNEMSHQQQQQQQDGGGGMTGMNIFGQGGGGGMNGGGMSGMSGMSGMNGMNGMSGGFGEDTDGTRTVMNVTALYDQAASCMASAREVLAFAEPFITEERDRVRNDLLKGG